MPNSCLWPISQQAPTWLWQTPRAAVSAWQTGNSPTRWFSRVKNNSTYKEECHSTLTAPCSIRIIKRTPKGRGRVKREKSVEIRKWRGLCRHGGEIGNTRKRKENWPRCVLTLIVHESFVIIINVLVAWQKAHDVYEKNLPFRTSNCSVSSYWDVK